MGGLRKLAQLKPIAEEALAGTVFLGKLLCGLHVANTYVCTAALTYGPSMLPTLNLTGDFILAERISTRFGRVGVGDIVLVRSPENPRKVMAKRLMGMEGDSVTYVVDPKNNDWRETVVVPKGHGKYSGGCGHLKVLDLWRRGNRMRQSYEKLSYRCRSSRLLTSLYISD
ncbi:hypothetical protein SDJN03_11033, partial [Cucurbita argyrosperma subsp. sororia]